MAQYRLHDKDEWVACPYDRAEMMPAKTLVYHLARCPKKHNAKYGTCPFNAKHKIPQAELRHHLATCPDRIIIEPELSYNQKKVTGLENPLKGCTDTPVYSDVHIPSTEDWDTDSVSQRVAIPTFGSTHSNRAVFYRDPARSGPAILHQDRVQQGNRWGEQVPNSHAVPQPEPQPRIQPTSSVYAYSISRGRGRGRGQALANSGAETGVGHQMTFQEPMYGRGSAVARDNGAPGNEGPGQLKRVL